MEARDRIAREREEQRTRERSAGWGEPEVPEFPPVPQPGAGRHYVAYPSRPSPSPSKADRILGRSPNQYSDTSVSMQNLQPRDEDHYDTSSDEDDPVQRVIDKKSVWPQRVGMVTNTLLGNTLARQKDDVRGWDGMDDGGVD